MIQQDYPVWDMPATDLEKWKASLHAVPYSWGIQTNDGQLQRWLAEIAVRGALSRAEPLPIHRALVKHDRPIGPFERRLPYGD